MWADWLLSVCPVSGALTALGEEPGYRITAHLLPPRSLHLPPQLLTWSRRWMGEFGSEGASHSFKP